MLCATWRVWLPLTSTLSIDSTAAFQRRNAVINVQQLISGIGADTLKLFLELFPCTTAAEFQSGGGGLSSTAADYLKIITCFLNEGVGANGARILKAETVKMMFQNSLTPELTAKLENPVESSRAELSNTIPNLQLG